MAGGSKFNQNVLNHFHARKIIRIKCGENHRFIGLWPIVVENRMFIRSWSVKKTGWYHAFLQHPTGKIQFEEKEIRINTRRVSSIRLNKLINEAYHSKYDTPGALEYVRDLCKKKSVDATLELIKY